MVHASSKANTTMSQHVSLLVHQMCNLVFAAEQIVHLLILDIVIRDSLQTPLCQLSGQIGMVCQSHCMIGAFREICTSTLHSPYH